MKTRPKPSLTLREIYESVVDSRNSTWTVEQQQSLQNVFVALAVGLENTVNELDYLESDLTEETERRVESIDELVIDIRNLGITLEAHSASLSEAVYMRDMPEILADICKRLDRLERSVQLLKFPEMLKG